MEYSRRKFLVASTATIGSATLLNSVSAQQSESPSCYSSRQYELPTPSEPADLSNNAVISEAYGELVLSPDRPYWVWPVCSASDPVTIEYEVRPKDGTSAPSILVVNDEGLAKYQTKVRGHPLVDGPLVSTTTKDFGWVGTHEVLTDVHLENVHPWNLFKQGDSRQSWEENSSMVRVYTTTCLNSAESGSIHKRHTIEPDRYYVVFDWTDEVLQEPDKEQVSVEVSLRATQPLENQIEETAPASMEQFYSQLAAPSEPLVATTVNLAEAICEQVPAAFKNGSVTEIHDKAPRASQLVSSVNILFTLLENHLGYNPTIMQSITARTSTWTRWGLSALPVASSIDQLLDDACAVADANPTTVTDEVENMLMSIGILIADLVAAYYGVAGRAAKFVVGMAHKYFLGVVVRTLGLETYLVLLRELYTLTRSGIAEALQTIKAVTRAIAREYDWLDDEDVMTVENLDRNSLFSLDLDIDLFSLSPECST